MASQRIEQLLQIEDMALKGMSDEEMAKNMNWHIREIIHARMALGIRKTWKISLFDDWKKAGFRDRYGSYFQFGLSRTELAELGMNPDEKVEFTGKILNKKLVLSLRNV